MASVTVHCPCCQSAQVYRHGQTPNGHYRFRCRDCHRVFQFTYADEARKPGVKEQTTENGFQRCRCTRHRQDAENQHQYSSPDFKKLSQRRITSSPVAHADVALICELDEQWSVGSKARQHWLWYAYSTKNGGVLPTLLVHEPIKPVVNYWRYSHRLTSVC